MKHDPCSVDLVWPGLASSSSPAYDEITYEISAAPPAQRFRRGDLVRIARSMPSGMSHFPCDCEAIVIGSYADLFGGEEDGMYSLHLDGGRGECSWYPSEVLTLIERDAHDLLKQWKDVERDVHAMHTSLEWIFEHGPRMSAAHRWLPHDSLQTLFSMLGGGNLWGARGEGIDLQRNMQITMSHALPYLARGDRAGWESYCADIRARKA